MHHTWIRAGLLWTALFGVSCGGSGKTPTDPGTTASSSNRPPSISISVSRTFGMAQLATFAFTAAASDPDGDPVAVSWNFGDGTTASGTNATRTYVSSGVMSVVATASDNKGASTASSTLSVTVGSPSGQWTGTVDLNVCLPGVVKPVSAALTQSGGSVTGSVELPQGLCSFLPGTAVTDPAEPGTIDASGAFRVRVKIPPFTDVYFEGQMDSTGRRITGGLRGSGHNGTPFVWNKQ